MSFAQSALVFFGISKGLGKTEFIVNPEKNPILQKVAQRSQSLVNVSLTDPGVLCEQHSLHTRPLPLKSINMPPLSPPDTWKTALLDDQVNLRCLGHLGSRLHYASHCKVFMEGPMFQSCKSTQICFCSTNLIIYCIVRTVDWHRCDRLRHRAGIGIILCGPGPGLADGDEPKKDRRRRVCNATSVSNTVHQIQNSGQRSNEFG